MLPLKISLPTRAPAPPAGPDWLHEIKHDGFRMIARRDGERTRLISRRGLDWGDPFPAIMAAVEALAVRSCTIDGEVIACDGAGLADFELLRYRRRNAAVTLVASDLIELDGHDLRREPIETRKSGAGTASRRVPGGLTIGSRVKNPEAPAVRREAEEDWAR
jgi:ATP-dependent DNA ligase